MKWLVLHKWRRLFHSSRVKLPFVNISASRCLMSTCLIWIFGSGLVLSSNQSCATLWVRDTCLIVGLLSLMTIFITASLSSKMLSIAPKWEDFTYEEKWSTLHNSRSSRGIGVLVWKLVGLLDDVPRNRSLCTLSLWVFWIGWKQNVTLQYSDPKDREREFRPCVDLHQEK